MTRKDFFKTTVGALFAGFLAKKAEAKQPIDTSCVWICGLKADIQNGYMHHMTWEVEDDFFPFLFLNKKDIPDGYAMTGMNQVHYRWDKKAEIWWQDEMAASSWAPMDQVKKPNYVMYDDYGHYYHGKDHLGPIHVGYDFILNR